eukprot:Gb_19755 [translate_table: standard]
MLENSRSTELDDEVKCLVEGGRSEITATSTERSLETWAVERVAGPEGGKMLGETPEAASEDRVEDTGSTVTQVAEDVAEKGNREDGWAGRGVRGVIRREIEQSRRRTGSRRRKI